ncbi:MAG TPA: hypothetical protein VMV44_11760 [Rectinemataceae bacterium]|nr:hypothetical protein [Rectinemataceae bacterium]
MISIVDELLERLGADPRPGAWSGPRQDLGLLLFAEREAINELWKVADRNIRTGGGADDAELREAVERLRDIFGERL